MERAHRWRQREPTVPEMTELLPVDVVRGLPLPKPRAARPGLTAKLQVPAQPRQERAPVLVQQEQSPPVLAHPQLGRPVQERMAQEQPQQGRPVRAWMAQARERRPQSLAQPERVLEPGHSPREQVPVRQPYELA